MTWEETVMSMIGVAWGFILIALVKWSVRRKS